MSELKRRILIGHLKIAILFIVAMAVSMIIVDSALLYPGLRWVSFAIFGIITGLVCPTIWICYKEAIKDIRK